MNTRLDIQAHVRRSLPLKLAGLALVGMLALTGTARADAVTDWNEITMNAVAAGRPGPIGSMDIALVQVAVHDAVQAIDKRFEPYHAEVKNARGSRVAAVAAAAHGMLVGMYPTQAAGLDGIYYDYLADKGLTGDAGLQVGAEVVAKILPLRRANPATLPPPFVGGTNAGQWRPTESFLPGAPASFSPMATPWMAQFDPFTLTGPTRFRLDPPPALTSERYRRDFDEVKSLGALNSTTRTPEQTDLAYFFTDNIFAQWNRALRSIALQRIERVGDSARLFALANLAVADSIIVNWDSKAHHAFWRPVTAIREADSDGNPNTIADAGWQPLANTPNYPDYPSGVNSVTGAMTRTLALFFGTDRMTFELTSNAANVVNRTRVYHRFSDAVRDTVDARVYTGFHFRFADMAGRAQSTRVADWTFNHFLLPCTGDSH